MARSSSVLGAFSLVVVLVVAVSSTVMDSTLPLASVVSICFFFCICNPKDDAFCSNTSGLLSMLPSTGCLAEAGRNSSFLCLALARQSALGSGEILRGATSFLGSALQRKKKGAWLEHIWLEANCTAPDLLPHFIVFNAQDALIVYLFLLVLIVTKNSSFVLEFGSSCSGL